MSVGVIRVAVDGLLQRFDGFFILTTLVVGLAEVEIGIGNVRRARMLFDVLFESSRDLFDYLRGQGL